MKYVPQRPEEKYRIRLDNGEGISNETQEHLRTIFDEIWQNKTDEKEGKENGHSIFNFTRKLLSDNDYSFYADDNGKYPDANGIYRDRY